VGKAERDLILLYIGAELRMTKPQRVSVKVGGRNSCVVLAPFQGLGWTNQMSFHGMSQPRLRPQRWWLELFVDVGSIMVHSTGIW
jgi:hypothetical protein